MFNDEVAHLIINAAKLNGIDPAALLAIVEVETGGKTFEADGRTPQFLYERHVAYKEAAKISKSVLNSFVRAGLAIPKWNRATQYRDERTSAQRLDLIARARAIHEEVANRSASWGLGQTMGFLAEELGFGTATELVEFQTGSVANQVECMVRELKHSDLVRSLNTHDWKRVARVYNGSGYAANKYDTRLADAYVRWQRKLPRLLVGDLPRDLPPEQLLASDEIEDIQKKLRVLGFYEVGVIDGHWNTKMTGAISAFQAHQGLHVTGHYDADTKAALESAEMPREVPMARAEATADDLRDMGSNTIAHADTLATVGNVGKAAGGVLVAGGTAEQTGLLDTVQQHIETVQDVANKVSQGKDIVEQHQGVVAWLRDGAASLLNHPAVLIGGIAIFFGFWIVGCFAKKIIDNRVADHRSGVHAGPDD